MKKLCLLLLLSSLSVAQEIRRPTADVDNIGANCTGTGVATSAMANSYDASGLSTSSDYTINGVTSGTSKRGGRSFTTWAAASGSYTALSLNVNASAVDNGQALMFASTLQYSLDGGGSWTTIINGGSAGFAQQTFTVTLSTSQALSNVQVRSCIAVAGSSGGTAGAGTITIWDIWTSGTIIVNNVEAVAETVTVSPSISAIHNAVESVSETTTVSPVVVDGLNMHEALAETNTLSLALSLGAGRKIADTLTVSPATAIVSGKNISESLSVGVTNSRLVTLHDSLSESLVVSPVALTIANHVIAASQPLSIADSDAIGLGMHYNLTSTVTVSPGTTLGHGRFVADSMLVSLTAAGVRGSVRAVADGFTFKALLSALTVKPHSILYTNHEVGIVSDALLVSVHSAKKKSTTVIMSL